MEYWSTGGKSSGGSDGGVGGGRYGVNAVGSEMVVLVLFMMVV